MQALRIWAQHSACSKWKTKEDGAVETERRLLLTLLLPSASALVPQLTDAGTCACSSQSHLKSAACGGEAGGGQLLLRTISSFLVGRTPLSNY